MIKRFDRLEVATSDLADAASVYERNFGFKVRREADNEAAITIGDAGIRLLSGAGVADVIASSSEGLAAIWLEAEDVETAAAELKRGGIAFAPIRKEGERRILAIDARFANMVPLFIFDRRA
jgi:hypothetical protein